MVCDVIEPFPNFDAEAYMGNWYVIQKSYGAPFDSNFFYRTQATYSNLDLETGSFDVTNTIYLYPTEIKSGLDGTAAVRNEG